MTRREALRNAIMMLESNRADKEVISKLTEMLDEYPSPHWTKEKIIDAFEDWIKNNGRAPSTTILEKERCLPSASSIKNSFGITARAFLEEYFPEASRSIYINGHGFATPEEWGEKFREEFIRIKATSASDYNKRRDTSIPQYGVIMRILNLSSWDELRGRLSLPSYVTERKTSPRLAAELEIEWMSPDRWAYEEVKEEHLSYMAEYPVDYDYRN